MWALFLISFALAATPIFNCDFLINASGTYYLNNTLIYNQTTAWGSCIVINTTGNVIIEGRGHIIEVNYRSNAFTEENISLFYTNITNGTLTIKDLTITGNLTKGTLTGSDPPNILLSQKAAIIDNITIRDARLERTKHDAIIFSNKSLTVNNSRFEGIHAQYEATYTKIAWKLLGTRGTLTIENTIFNNINQSDNYGYKIQIKNSTFENISTRGTLGGFRSVTVIGEVLLRAEHLAMEDSSMKNLLVFGPISLSSKSYIDLQLINNTFENISIYEGQITGRFSRRWGASFINITLDTDAGGVLRSVAVILPLEIHIFNNTFKNIRNVNRSPLTSIDFINVSIYNSIPTFIAQPNITILNNTFDNITSYDGLLYLNYSGVGDVAAHVVIANSTFQHFPDQSDSNFSYVRGGTEATLYIFNNIFNISHNITAQLYQSNTQQVVFLNISPSPGPNIINGPYIGGNFWGRPDGTGYSETCEETDGDGFCDYQYNLTSSLIDYYPLTYPNNSSASSSPPTKKRKNSPPDIEIVSPEPITYNQSLILFSVYGEDRESSWLDCDYWINQQQGSFQLYTWENFTRNLNPGNYTFEVVCDDGQGKSDSDSVSFEVHIPPPVILGNNTTNQSLNKTQDDVPENTTDEEEVVEGDVVLDGGPGGNTTEEEVIEEEPVEESVEKPKEGIPPGNLTKEEVAGREAVRGPGFVIGVEHIAVPVLLMLLLLLRVAKVQIIPLSDNRSRVIVRTLWGSPIKNAVIKIKGKLYRTDQSGSIIVEEVVYKKDVKVRWYITI